MPTSSFKKLVCGFGIGLVSNIVHSLPTWAQNFTISPMVTITQSQDGQSKGSININNKGKEPLRMRVYAEDFTYERKKGFVSIGNHDRSAVPYLQFSPRELVIPAGVTRSVRISTLLPPGTPDKEYRAVIFVEDLKERDIKSSTGNAVVIKTRVASVFYTSKGDAKSALSIDTAIFDNTEKKLKIVLTNKGKKSAYPDIAWRIEKDGKQVAKDALRGILVQSENEREISLSENGKEVSLPSGNYTVSGEITNGSQKGTPFSVKVSIP